MQHDLSADNCKSKLHLILCENTLLCYTFGCGVFMGVFWMNMEKVMNCFTIDTYRVYSIAIRSWKKTIFLFLLIWFHNSNLKTRNVVINFLNRITHHQWVFKHLFYKRLLWANDFCSKKAMHCNETINSLTKFPKISHFRMFSFEIFSVVCYETKKLLFKSGVNIIGLSLLGTVPI